MVRRTLVVLTVALLGLPGVVLLTPERALPQESTVQRESEITIRGKYDAPARISFDYSEHETVEPVRVSTGDSPTVPPPERFANPALAKETKVESESPIVRPRHTVVDEYSMLELLGFGAGAFAVLLLL